MTSSFLEIPQLALGGNELPSLYVNVADIIALRSDDGATRLEVRSLGTDGLSVTLHSYLPIGMFLDMLTELARWPGVRSWPDHTKRAYGEPAAVRARRALMAQHQSGDDVYDKRPDEPR